jgi:hypothetical protein
MTIRDKVFLTGDVLRAAGISNALFQTWVRRGAVTGSANQPIESPGSPGFRRRFSFGNVIEIAIAAALAAVGVELGHAFRAAALVAYTGADGRLPSFPFQGDARTLLAVAGERSLVFASDTLGLTPTQWHGLGRPETFVVVVVSDIFDRVADVLGEHPQRLTDVTYRDHRADG